MRSSGRALPVRISAFGQTGPYSERPGFAAVAEAYGAWGEKTAYGKMYKGLIRSHFGIDADGRLSEAEVQVKPLSTADLALKLITL